MKCTGVCWGKRKNKKQKNDGPNGEEENGDKIKGKRHKKGEK